MLLSHHARSPERKSIDGCSADCHAKVTELTFVPSEDSGHSRRDGRLPGTIARSLQVRARASNFQPSFFSLGSPTRGLSGPSSAGKNELPLFVTGACNKRSTR